MSSSIPAQPEGSQPLPPPVARKLTITIAVKTEGGQWVSPQLNETDQKQITSAIEAIRHMGETTQANWPVFNESGAVLEMTSQGIFRKEGNQWRDLLSDRTVNAELRGTVRKTLQAMTSTIGHLSVDREKRLSSQDLAKAADTLRKGNVVIQVKVDIPSAVTVSQRIDSEKTFNKNLVDLRTQLSDPESVSFLEANGFNAEHQARTLLHLEALITSSDSLLELLTDVKKLMDEGNLSEAAARYNQEMPARYGQFCDSLRVWQREHQVFTNNFGAGYQFPAQVDFNHLENQLELAKTLNLLAGQPLLARLETSEPLKKMVKSQEAFHKEAQLAKDLDHDFRALEEKEKAFNLQLVKSLKAFEDPIFTDGLLEDRWTQEEIDAYRERLVELKSQSDRMLTTLDGQRAWLANGFLQEGADLFFRSLQEEAIEYTQTVREFVIPMQVAQGRNLTLPLFPFRLDLRHPLSYSTIGATILARFRKANITNADGSAAFQTDLYQPMIDGLLPSTQSLEEELNFPLLVQRINGELRANQKLTESIGTFVQAYQNNRELFEQIMRAHGISDLESSFIFNAYAQVHQAFQRWDQSFKTVLDLANQKKYEEALREYGNVVQNGFDPYVKTVREVLYNVSQLANPELAAAFDEFGARVGIANPPNLRGLLSMERTLPKQELILRDSIESAEKGNIPVPEEAKAALSQMRSVISEVNQKVDEFGRLFSVPNLLSLGQPKSIEEAVKKRWLETLVKNGLKPKDSEKLESLLERHAQVVRQIKQARHAIALESNPQKKRALQNQLKPIAEKLIMEVSDLRAEFQDVQLAKKMGQLEASAKQFSARENNLRTSLNREWDQHRAAFEAAGFLSLDDLIARLEGQFVTYSPEERKPFATAYDLVLSIHAGEKLVKDGLGLRKLLRDGMGYANGFFEEMGILGPERGIVEGALLRGPQTKDKQFTEMVKQHGWNRGKIQKLNDWFDDYRAASQPLELAKKALDSDPDNIVLQREFRKVAKEQFPKINQLTNQFSQTFGKMDDIRNLEWALTLYANRAAKDLKNLEDTLSQSLARPELMQDLIRQIDEKKEVLARFSTIRFADEIDRLNRILIEANQSAAFPMSGDADYLSLLDPKKSSPLMQLKNVSGEAIWSSLLAKRGLSENDVKKILKLQANYQNEMAEIIELERKLEETPENVSLRRNLLRQLIDRKEAIQQLIKQSASLSSKISELQASIVDYRSHLEQSMQKIAAQYAQQDKSEELGERLVAADNTIFPSIAEGLRIAESQTAFERKRLLGDLSDRQIQAQIRLLSQIDIRRSFDSRNEFLAETYRRFATL